MCEPDMNMTPPTHPSSPSPSQSPSPSPSTPSPQFRLHPNSPELSTQYTPKVLKRMQSDTCYRCQQIGHWSWHCPMNSPNAKPLPPSPNHDSPSPKMIWCRCGHGLCEVKTARTERNKGRQFYACPIKRGKPCRDFVKWCDDASINESDMQPPPYKYPECACGAGVCRKVKGPDGVKYYFACPIGENHGSCGYQVWEDELPDNKSIVPIRQSNQTTLCHFWGGYQNDKLCEGGDLLVEHSKRMRIMDNSESSSSMAVSELPGREDAAPKAVGFPEFEVADDLQEIANSVPWDAIEKKASLSSRRSTPSRIRRRQFFFQRLILSGIFPSFEPIVVPKQVSTHHGPCESNQLAISSLSQRTQLSTGIHTEVSRVACSSNRSPVNERKPMSMVERQRQVVLAALRLLLSDLETCDPHQHESMRQAAEDTFALLDGWSVDYKKFSEHVWDFINYASSMAEIEKSMENFLSHEEYNKLYDEEKLRLANIQDDYVKTEALLDACTKRRQSLGEEISHLEAMLREKQNQLNSCESEALKIESHLGDLKRSILKADTTLKVRAEQAEMARKLNEERQTNHTAAKAALEMAKHRLEI